MAERVTADERQQLDAEGRVTGRHYCAPCAARITNHHNNNQGETTK